MHRSLPLVFLLATISPGALAEKESEMVTRARNVFSSMTSGKGLLTASKDKPISYDLQSPEKACKGLGGKPRKATSGPDIGKLRACFVATWKRLGDGVRSNVFEQTSMTVDEAKFVKTAPKGTVVVVGNFTTGAATMNAS